jgi:hypothetical protein
MSGDIITAVGTKVYIGATVTSTAADSLAEFQAMTGWTEVGLVESIGAFGAKSNSVTFAALGDAYMRKQKGIRDAGDLTFTVAHDPTDAGQDAVEAAEAASGAYAFKITIPDSTSTIKYLRGYVMGDPIDIGANGNVVKKTYSVAIDGAVFTTP